MLADRPAAADAFRNCSATTAVAAAEDFQKIRFNGRARAMKFIAHLPNISGNIAAVAAANGCAIMTDNE